MVIKNVGINIDKDTIVEQTYKVPQNRRSIKLCEETDFKSGHIAYEDGVFLPEGTYVILKEKGKEDKIGKIFYFFSSIIEKEDGNKVALVDVHYDMNSNKQRLKMDEKLIIGFINKSMFGLNKNPDKFLQVISYEKEEDDDWEFVKIEYGNPDVKMSYKYGWKYWNGEIYEKKDINSKKITFDQYNRAVYLYKEKYTIDKQTNVEYKIKPNVKFVPYEEELIVVYIILLAITFIFDGRFIYWTIFTILFFIIRKKLRNKYNG